jgi:hypothetical protein
MLAAVSRRVLLSSNAQRHLTESAQSEATEVRTRLYSTWITIVLFAYSTVVNATLKLLYCVHIPGTATDERRLCIDATVKCGPWQTPLYLVLCVVLVLPLAQFWLVGVSIKHVREHEAQADGEWSCFASVELMVTAAC